MGYRPGYRPLDGASTARSRYGVTPAAPPPRRRPTVWFAQFVVGCLLFFPAATGCYIAGWALAGPVFGVIVTLFWLVVTLLVIGLVRDL